MLSCLKNKLLQIIQTLSKMKKYGQYYKWILNYKLNLIINEIELYINCDL